MILADKIINLRKKNGWSQEELAEKLGVTRQSISKYEGAQSIPDLDKILKVALTIMFMENESEIKPIHLMEAMTFRNTGFIKEVLEYGR